MTRSNVLDPLVDADRGFSPTTGPLILLLLSLLPPAPLPPQEGLPAAQMDGVLIGAPRRLRRMVGGGVGGGGGGGGGGGRPRRSRRLLRPGLAIWLPWVSFSPFLPFSPLAPLIAGISGRRDVKGGPIRYHQSIHDSSIHCYHSQTRGDIDR